MSDAILAIDFGTSNSAAAILDAGRLRRIPIEAEGETLPTAVFFPRRGAMRIGQEAAEALINGDEGRYMRALKSVLGTSLAHETRLIGGSRRSVAGAMSSATRSTRPLASTTSTRVARHPTGSVGSGGAEPGVGVTMLGDGGASSTCTGTKAAGAASSPLWSCRRQR